MQGVPVDPRRACRYHRPGQHLGQEHAGAGGARRSAVSKGVKFAIVHSAGFKEVGVRGRGARAEDGRDWRTRYGMRIFGPNSQGIQNADPEVSVYANFTFVPHEAGQHLDHRPGRRHGRDAQAAPAQRRPRPPHVLLVRQRVRPDDARDPGLLRQGPGHARDHDADRELQGSSVRSCEAAAAITPHKPILAIKAGRTREGSMAVSSHTGTLVDQAAMADGHVPQGGRGARSATPTR